MNKFWKIFQYAYLVIAALFIVEAIISWNSDRENSYIMLGFAIFITLIFLFKRNFRKKIEQRRKSN